jgi:hypothetical protein
MRPSPPMTRLSLLALALGASCASGSPARAQWYGNPEMVGYYGPNLYVPGFNSAYFIRPTPLPYDRAAYSYDRAAYLLDFRALNYRAPADEAPAPMPVAPPHVIDVAAARAGKAAGGPAPLSVFRGGVVSGPDGPARVIRVTAGQPEAYGRGPATPRVYHGRDG